MRYAMYLRKSRADDASEPIEVTLQRHRQALENYMVQHDLTVLPEDVYEEVVSGDSLYARPQMLRMLESIEAGKYTGVLCMDIQRLGRGSMQDQGMILDAFKFSGTKIITPSKTYDLSDDIDETYTEFESFMGRQEYKMIKKRLRRGIRATVENGGYIANAPYGYDKARVGKLPSLKINEEEAKFVRMMFDLYQQGMGSKTIADTVSRLGAKPRRGERFARTTVTKILKNPVYCGKIVWDRKTHLRPGQRGNEKHVTIYNAPEKWTIVDGVHPAIISQEQFDAVQVILSGHYHPPSNTGKRRNPLSGVVLCGSCGHPMQRIAIQSAGGPLLGCATPGCIVSSKLEYVEEAVLESIQKEFNRICSEADADKKADAMNYTEMAKAIDGEIRKAKQQLGRLHDLLEQGVYDVETFSERRQQLLGRISALEDERKNLVPPKQLDLEAMRRQIEKVMEVYPNSDSDTQNHLLKSIVEKVVYHKEKGAKPKDFALEVYLRKVYL